MNKNNNLIKSDNELLLPISRRSLLHGLGAGAILAAPLLRAALAEAAAGTLGMRLVIIPIQFGWGFPDDNTKSKLNTGRTVTYGNENGIVIPPWLSPFESLKQQVTILDGLRGAAWEKSNAHDVSYTDMLTNAVPVGTIEKNGGIPGHIDRFPRPQGPSIDFVLGKALNTGVLRLDTHYQSFGAQPHPTCFDDSRNFLEFQRDLKIAYNIVSSGITDSSSAPMAPAAPAFDALKAKNKMILDHATADINALRSKVGADVRDRLDLHLRALADTGANLGITGTGTVPPQKTEVSATCKKPGSAPSFNGDLEQFKLHLELVKTALACGTQRIAVVQSGDNTRLSDWTWTDANGNPKPGADLGNFHEEVSHWDSKGGDTFTRRLMVEGYYQMYAKAVAEFATQLNSIIEPDGKTLLDRTLIVLTGEVTDGSHNNAQKGIVIVGGGAAIKTGRTLRIARHPTDNVYGNPLGGRSEGDMWMAIAKAMGAPLTTFGIASRLKGDIILT